MCTQTYIYEYPYIPQVKGYSNFKVISGQFRNKTNSYITHILNTFPHYFPTSKSKGFSNTFTMLERVTKTQGSHISAAISCKFCNLYCVSLSGKNCKCKLGKKLLKKKKGSTSKLKYLLCFNPHTSNLISPELACMKKSYITFLKWKIYILRSNLGKVFTKLKYI